MPPLQIRSMPDEVYAELTQLAKDKHRSTVQQALVYIKRGIEQDKNGEVYQALMSNHMPPIQQPSYSDPYRISPQQRAERKEQLRKIFERLDAMPPLNLPEGFPTPEEMIREDRDSR